MNKIIKTFAEYIKILKESYNDTDGLKYISNMIKEGIYSGDNWKLEVELFNTDIKFQDLEYKNSNLKTVLELIAVKIEHGYKEHTLNILIGHDFLPIVPKRIKGYWKLIL